MNRRLIAHCGGCGTDVTSPSVEDWRRRDTAASERVLQLRTRQRCGESSDVEEGRVHDDTSDRRIRRRQRRRYIVDSIYHTHLYYVPAVRGWGIRRYRDPSVCPSCPGRAAARGYRHAGCLQLSHVRTADPSADGLRSAASQTAVGGGISSRRPRCDNLFHRNW